jgi:alpha-L-rhamnosidase
MRRYVEYLAGLTERHICTIGLGDWCSPEEAPPANDRLLLTACFSRMPQILSESARILGRASDADLFAGLARDVAGAIRAELLPVVGTQTNLSVLLYFGLTEDPAADLGRLLQAVAAAGEHIQCGIFGTKYIVDVLTRHGHFGVAYRMMSKTDYPSYTHMLANGSGTIWERWDGRNSRNHAMFGSIAAWYFKALAGLCIDESEPGFTTVVLRPHFTADVHNLSAWHETPRGRLAVSYDREHLSVTLPPQTVAKLCLDGQAVPLSSGDHAQTFSVDRREVSA